MKSLAFAAALLVGTAAIAQSTTPTTTPSTGTVMPTTPGTGAATPPMGTASDGTMSTNPAPASDPASPTPSAPSTDTNGTMGTTGTTGTTMGQPGMSTNTGPGMSAPTEAPAPTTQASYPRCSATVTDQCRQGSARESDRRGGPRKRRG